MAPKNKVKVVPEMNISLAVFNRWQELFEYGDNGKIARFCEIDATTITKAIKYGHCKKGLEDRISDFFLQKIEASEQEEKKPIEVSEASSKLLKMKVV